MRDALEAFVEYGGNVGFFSGNTCFWQVRWEDAGETMVCYKYQCQQDPVLGSAEERRLTSAWSDRAICRPKSVDRCQLYPWRLCALWRCRAPWFGWLHDLATPAIGL